MAKVNEEKKKKAENKPMGDKKEKVKEPTKEEAKPEAKKESFEEKKPEAEKPKEKVEKPEDKKPEKEEAKKESFEEKKEDKIEEAKPEEKVEKKTEEKKIAKKWKGKDWFVVIGPSMFGSNAIAETPTTDPKSLINRNIGIGVSELINDPAKTHMRMKFKIFKVDEKRVYTEFNGYSCVKEHVFRIVRKGAEKVKLVNNFETIDKWKLQISAIVILNRNTNIKVRTKMRLWAESQIRDFLSKSTIDSLILSVINGSLQKGIKKRGSKIYPVRFAEIEKIEVLKRPES